MQAFALKDVTVELSPWITGTAAGDGDVFVLGRVTCGRGRRRCWTFTTASGPGLVDVVVYGSFATRLIRPAGLAAIRHI